MISLMNNSRITQQLLKKQNSLDIFGKGSKPSYVFSESIKEYSDMMQQIGDESMQLGKGQFRQLYFPIKRIHFEKNTQFQKIFQNSSRQMSSIKRSSRLMRLAYHIPFVCYFLNYEFFLTPGIVHQLALASLFISANAKAINDSFKLSREIAELYLSQDAQKFIAVLPKVIVSSNINELQGQLKGSIFDQNECLGFNFSLDDIESISLFSNDQQKIKQEVTEKIGTKKTSSSSADTLKQTQAEQKQQILEKLSKIQDNDESLIITISKQEWNCSRTFKLNLNSNDLSQFNDYMVALGYKQRIVMRESMNPKFEQPQKEESKSNSQTKEQNTNKQVVDEIANPATNQ